MTDFFAHCRTSDEIKAEYRRLAMIHHPDHGGDTATMQALNAAYSFAIGKTTRQEKPGRTEAEYSDLDAVNEAIRAAILKIVRLPRITIEVCGLWVWVSGETRAVKNQLKAAGFHWACKKEKWYFAGVPASNHGEYSMDHIRDRYGSKIVRQKEEETC